MANTIALTDFVSRVAGVYLDNKRPLIATSYQGIDEFERTKNYGVADTVNFKIPGYITVQTGLSITAQDITDQTFPYVLSDNDIYNAPRQIDFRRIKTQIVGGRRAIIGDPTRLMKAGDPRSINPQARVFIDNYALPDATAIASAIEISLARKGKSAACYTPIDTPASLGSVNSYSDISSVDALMQDLGWIENRMGAMNIQDAKNVADSLQNMFNETINENITRNARLGGPNKGRLANIDIYRSTAIENTLACPQFAIDPNLTVETIASDGSSITFLGAEVSTNLLITAGTMISLPTINWINKPQKTAISTKVVVTAKSDVLGDGTGRVTVPLSMPLIAVGDQQNVSALPAGSAAAEIFPAHKNNYFYVPMGFIANCLPLDNIEGADNGLFNTDNGKIMIHTSIQGVNLEGTNSYRMSCLMPTLAVPFYLINLPSLIS